MSSEGAGKNGNEERKVKRDGGDGENVPRENDGGVRNGMDGWMCNRATIQHT